MKSWDQDTWGPVPDWWQPWEARIDACRSPEERRALQLEIDKFMLLRQIMDLAKEHLLDDPLDPRYEESLADFKYWVDDLLTTHFEALAEPEYEPARPRRRRTISAATRLRIFERDGYECVCCGARHNLCVDHIHPWSQGGFDHLENYQTLCQSCNSSKGDREKCQLDHESQP